MTAPANPSTAEEAVPTLAPELVAPAAEALLLMATEPLGSAELAGALGLPEAVVAETLAGLARFYRETGRGFELRRVGGGWRYFTRPDLACVIGQSVVAGQHGRLTQAGLETLAVIAYLQPISRSRIAAVRGVNVDGVVRTLLAHDLIVETGKDETTGAALLVTTDRFLERLGLADLADLPPLAPHLPDATALDAELSDIVAASLGAGPPSDDDSREGLPGRGTTNHEEAADD